MAERPILFSGPMVRAILSGAKTQTRRVVKPQPFSNGSYSNHGHGNFDVVCHNDYLPPDAFMWQPRRGLTMSDYEDDWTHECSPYGKPGDRLWVRETWAAHALDGSEPPQRVLFQADGANYNCGDLSAHPKRGPKHLDHPDWVPARWRPSIHMPRWASRILLEVTSVDVERLQSIDAYDAVAEGIKVPRCDCEVCMRSVEMCPADQSAHIMQFSELWDSINRKSAPWESNPWVWVVSFKRVTP